MVENITPEQLAQIREFIRNNPIDHKYDGLEDYMDADIPPNQLMARDFREMLDARGIPYEE